MSVGVIWKRSRVFLCSAQKDAYCVGSCTFFGLVANVTTLHNANGISCICCLRIAVKHSKKVVIQIECCRADFGGEFSRQNDTGYLLWGLMGQRSILNTILATCFTGRLSGYWFNICKLWGFYSGIDVSILLKYGTAAMGNLFETFRDELLISTSKSITISPLLLETSGTNYRLTRCHIWQERGLIQHFCFQLTVMFSVLNTLYSQVMIVAEHDELRMFYGVSYSGQF
jgi:hypothetical protein